jgi:phospholipid transport system substrate-binding protein
MTAFNRRHVVALAAALAIASAAPSIAHADASSEAYVQTNATTAINALNATGSAAERSQQFGVLFEKFADIGAISTDVLPRAQKLQVNADAKLKAEWVSAFRDYAMATYEDQLDRYRGSSLKVTGSKDSVVNGKTKSRVRAEMSQKKGEPLVIYWYLEKTPASWRVADVGLVLGDSEVKLAVMQRDQLAAVLQRNGGDMKKLITQIRTQTASMRERIKKKNA